MAVLRAMSWWRATGVLGLWLLVAAVGYGQPPTPKAANPKAKPKSMPRGEKPRGPSRMGKSASPLAGSPGDYTSQNFLLHTDLPEEEATELLSRLETMLGLIAKYWGRPNQQVIEMFVVRDFDRWNREALEPEGVRAIQTGGGVTMTRKMVLGDEFQAKSRVFASADHGTPQHEAVHAYCDQTFGRTGPTWYAEGMAEMGQYWRDKDLGVNARPEVLRYLKGEEPKPISEIVAEGQQTGDSWQNYAWRWALCHLLANNPNYRERFRPLGLGLLNDQRVSFETVYGAMLPEIRFEYEFFLKHVEPGYRVDLCGWDWKSKGVALKGTGVATSKIEAQRGWQHSRLQVKSGTTYSYTATGEWSTGPERAPTTAAGNDEGQGKLVGVLLKDRVLSLPFELGASGTWTADQDGVLFLRCQEAWGTLGDNKGTITVKMTLATE